MTQVEGRTPSQIVPLLVPALVCDAAVEDQSTGKKTLIGIFNAVNVQQFPSQRPFCLYFKVTDAEGFYQIEVRYVRVDTGEILANAEGEMMAPNRLDDSDLYLQFPPLPIPEPGRYEFQIWANSAFLGSTSIRAIPLEV